jgi:hypothetical protein
MNLLSLTTIESDFNGIWVFQIIKNYSKSFIFTVHIKYDFFLYTNYMDAIDDIALQI